MKIAVVIPCYKVKKFVLEVINDISDDIKTIICIDDACPENSGDYIINNCQDKRVIVLKHKINQGVGGTVLAGYKKALEMDIDIVVKVDGDGQMDARYIKALIQPIVRKKAGYTKGNRFVDFKALSKMPKIRLLGNSGLSFLVKGASGYWNLMDPTNGFTAISKHTIKNLTMDNIAKDYFFESDMLINLNIEGVVVKDVPIPSKYGDEESSLSITKTLISFPPRLFNGFIKRIFLKYFIYDFNMASVYMLAGFPLFFFGCFYGVYRWILGVVENEINSTGTVMFSVLPIMLGVQFLLQAIQIDIDSVPKNEEEM